MFFCAALLLTLLPSMQDAIVLDLQRVFAGVAAIRWATPLFFAVLICLWCAGQSTDHDFHCASSGRWAFLFRDRRRLLVALALACVFA